MSIDAGLPASIASDEINPRPSLFRVTAWMFWRWARWELVGIAAFTLVSLSFAYVVQLASGPEAPARDTAQTSPSPFSTTMERPESPTHSLVWKWATGTALLMSFAAIVVGASWPFTEFDSSGSRGPDRWFRLPVASWKLVLAYMLPGLSFAFVVASAYAIGFQAAGAVESPWWIGACAAVMLTAIAQAWTLAFAPHHAKAGTFALVLLTLLAARFVVVASNAPVTRLPMLAPIAVLLVLPVCFALGVVGLTVNRRGGIGTFRHTALDRLNDLEVANTRARRFRSAAEAQRWYEWRRVGWHLPALQCAFIAMYFLLIPGLIWGLVGVDAEFRWFFENWAMSRDAVNTALFLALVLPAALAGCIMMGFDLDTRNGNRSFLFTRPQSVAFLMHARYVTVLKNAALGYLPILVVVIFFASFGTTREGLAGLLETPERQVSLTRVLVLVAVPLAAAWALHCTPNLAASFAALAAFIPVFVWVIIANLKPIPIDESTAQTVVVILSIVYAAILLVWLLHTVRQAIRIGAITRQSIRNAIALWLLVTIAAALYAGPMNLLNGVTKFDPVEITATTFAFAATLLPPAVLITSPYVLHRLRHRN